MIRIAIKRPTTRIASWMYSFVLLLFIAIGMVDSFHQHQHQQPIRIPLLSSPSLRRPRLWSSSNSAEAGGEQEPLSASVPKPDGYKVLGLPREATVEQVKARYRKLAKAYHPDANPENERNTTTILFQTIQEAYEVVVAKARYRRDLQKKKDEAQKKQELFVRVGIDTIDTSGWYNASSSTNDGDYVHGVHAPSSPTEAERDLRARATGSYQSTSESSSSPPPPSTSRSNHYNRPPPHRGKKPIFTTQTPYNSNSPHRPWPAPTPGDSDWDVRQQYHSNSSPMSTPYASARRTPYVYNPNPHRHRRNNSGNNYQQQQRQQQRPMQPPNYQQPKNGYVPHSVAQPRGPSWSRPRPPPVPRVRVQANAVDGQNWNAPVNPFAGGSAPSSRPRPKPKPRPNFVKPNFGVDAPPAGATRRRNVFTKRRPPPQPYQPPASGWWGETTTDSTGTYNPPSNNDGWRYNNQDFPNGPNNNNNNNGRRPQNYNNEDYFSDVVDEE